MDLVTAAAVRRAVEAKLQQWMPWVLARLRDIEDLTEDELPTPADEDYREFHSVDDLTDAHRRWPAIAVVAADEDFTRRGDAGQDGTWDLTVAVVSRGIGHDHTVTVNDAYRAAIRYILDGDQLDGFAREVKISGGGYRPVGDTSRLLLVGTVTGTVHVADVTPRPKPPPFPDLDDEGDAPTVSTTNVDIDHLDLDQLEES